VYIHSDKLIIIYVKIHKAKELLMLLSNLALILRFYMSRSEVPYQNTNENYRRVVSCQDSNILRATSRERLMFFFTIKHYVWNIILHVIYEAVNNPATLQCYCALHGHTSSIGDVTNYVHGKWQTANGKWQTVNDKNETAAVYLQLFCTVEWKYLYLRWIHVGGVYLLLYDLNKD